MEVDLQDKVVHVNERDAAKFLVKELGLLGTYMPFFLFARSSSNLSDLILQKSSLKKLESKCGLC